MDQWATARVNASEGPTLGLHYGRSAVALAAESIELSRPLKLADVAYARLGDRLPDAQRIVVGQIAGYGSALLIVLLLACVLRVAGGVTVGRAGGFTGPAAFTYVMGTVAVASVFVVALLFNGSSLIQAVSIAISQYPQANVQSGWGISTWAAMAALLVDGAGILAVNTLSGAGAGRGARRRR
jgi:hypothetical protein